MKKVLPVLITLIFLVFSSQIFAQEATTSVSSRELLLNQKKPPIKPLAAQKIENRLENRAEKIASRTAQLKVKLRTFKDQVRAKAAERINESLNKINTNRTTEMSNQLNKMNEILAKVEQQSTKVSTSGKDAASSSAAISAAKEAISTASKAVTAQSEKDYTISVSTEGRIALDAKTQRDQLLKDLKDVRKLVIDAKQAVALAISTLRSGGQRNGQ